MEYEWSTARTGLRGPRVLGTCSSLLIMNDRIKVLSIAGSGRSGSTILGNILGQINGFFHVGELCYLWNRGLVNNTLCGCGSSFRDCNLWRGVLAHAGLALDKDDAAEMSRVLRDINRTLPVLMLVRKTNASLASGPARYLSAVQKLYQSIHHLTGCRVIVDSSKVPAHGYLLKMIPEIDLHVVHLVRDPRAVAYSWQRKALRSDRSSENPAAMERVATWKSTIKWAYANIMIDILRDSNFGKGKVATLHYEDFVRDPRQTVATIVTLVDKATGALPFVSQHEVDLEPTHTVWGNPNRLQTGRVQLRLDDEWKINMKWSKRAFVTALTWPLLLKYRHLEKNLLDFGSVRPSI